MISKSLLESFSDDLKNVLKVIFDENLFVTLVGGAVRDCVLNGFLPLDLDFELRAEQKIKDHDWVSRIDLLCQIFKERGYKVDQLPFAVFRIHLADQQVEFASPRVENFKDDDNGHKNFEVDLDPQLDYGQAFARRDFTINAIGLEIRDLNSFKIIDPLGGLKDIADKVLRPCGPSFIKDPVRLLRAIRFKMTTGFKFSPDLNLMLSKFNLDSLSGHYLRYESVKSRDIVTFFKELFIIIDNYTLIVNFKIEHLRFITKLPQQLFPVDSVDNLTLALVLDSQITESELINFAEIFQIKKVSIIQFRSYLLSLALFDQTMEARLKIASLAEDFDEPALQICLAFIDLNTKLTYKDQLKELLGKLYSSEYQVVKRMQLDNLRGGELFKERLKKSKIPDRHKGLFRLMCHFQKLYERD